MNSGNDVAILMSLSDSGAVRKFVMLATEYIDKQFNEFVASKQEEEGCKNGNVTLTVNAEDVFFYVFRKENVSGKWVVAGWNDDDKFDSESRIPDEIMGKSWEEILEIVRKAVLGCTKDDCAESNMVIMLFEALRLYLEYNGYYMGTFGGVRLDWIHRNEGIIRIYRARRARAKS